MKKIFTLFILLIAFSVYAIETNKPETHNSAWIKLHGNASKVDINDCLSCHVERVECIACHEDMAPRSHNGAWIQKNHGLESRWNRTDCKVCHKQDFCSECHEVSIPKSHTRVGFGTIGAATFHCQTSCQLPINSWQNTPSKNCLVCHRTRPIQKSGLPHPIN